MIMKLLRDKGYDSYLTRPVRHISLLRQLEDINAASVIRQPEPSQSNLPERALAPKALAPKAVALEVHAPEAAPKAVAPEALTPEALAPKVVTPVAPNP